MSERVRLTQLLTRLIGGISAPLLILLTDYRHNQVLLVLLVGTIWLSAATSIIKAPKPTCRYQPMF